MRPAVRGLAMIRENRMQFRKAAAAAAVGLVLGFPLYLISEVMGPETRSTGGNFPGERSCARSDCHGGDLNSGPGSIAVTFDGKPLSEYRYQPGRTVPVVVSVAEAGKVRWGFQATARDEDGCLQAGRFGVTGDPNVQIVTDVATPEGCSGGTMEFPEHNFPKAGGDGAEFSFEWTAPRDGFGLVRFAAAANAANGNNMRTGDNIYAIEAAIEPVGGLPAQPAISAGGVLMANLNPQIKKVSPRAIASVFGSDFSDQTVLAPAVESDGTVSKRLAGSCVEVQGERAPLFAMLPTQANFQVPENVGVNTSVDVVVIRNCDGPLEMRSEPQFVGSQLWAPGFFVFPQFGGADGANPIAALHQDGVNVVAPAGLFADTAAQAFSPAAEGEFVSLFMTALGPTDPIFDAGEIPGVVAPVTFPVEVSIGGITLAPADILYAGLAPCCAGLYQAVVKIPEGIGPGNHEVILRVNDFATPPGPFVTVE